MSDNSHGRDPNGSGSQASPEAPTDLRRPGFDPSRGWQPIATAPKDGSDVLVYGPAFNDPNSGDGYMAVGGFIRGAWRDDPEGNELHSPTHWMPLPAPPTGTGEAS